MINLEVLPDNGALICSGYVIRQKSGALLSFGGATLVFSTIAEANRQCQSLPGGKVLPVSLHLGETRERRS